VSPAGNRAAFFQGQLVQARQSRQINRASQGPNERKRQPVAGAERPLRCGGEVSLQAKGPGDRRGSRLRDCACPQRLAQEPSKGAILGAADSPEWQRQRTFRPTPGYPGPRRESALPESSPPFLITSSDKWRLTGVDAASSNPLVSSRRRSTQHEKGGEPGNISEVARVWTARGLSRSWQPGGSNGEQS
jgi:hypothetical protein